MPFKDSERAREYKREYYQKNKDETLGAIGRRKKAIKAWFKEYKKGLKCSKCGENHQATIDFHHTEKKEKAVAMMVHWGYSIERIKKEIEKCQILCANCHRKLHWKNKNL